MKIKQIQSIQSIHFLALLLGTVALSLAPIFVRFSETSSSSIAFWRMLIATPLLACAWWFMPNQTGSKNHSESKNQISTKKPDLRDYIFLILAGISFALDLLSWNISVELTTVANATLFVNFASLFVALLSWQILKIVPGKGLILGMILALCGSILLVYPDLSENSSLIGDGLGLVAAFFYGLYLLLVQIIRPSFSTMAIMTLTAIVTAITAFIAAFIFDQPLTVSSNTGWAALFGQAIIVQMIGQSLIAYALVSLPATLSSIILLLQPVLAALIAVWLFDETLIIIQSLGMFLILLGIIYAKMNSKLQTQSIPAKEIANV